MNAALRDDLAALRAQARHHREQGFALSKLRAQAKARRDPIAALKLMVQSGERYAAARQCEIRILEIKPKGSPTCPNP